MKHVVKHGLHENTFGATFLSSLFCFGEGLSGQFSCHSWRPHIINLSIVLSPFILSQKSNLQNKS